MFRNTTLFLLLLLGTCVPQYAMSEPMISEADDVLKSSVVVVGTLRDGPNGSMFIEVARVLRDDNNAVTGQQHQAGLRELSAVSTPDGTVGVFFLDGMSLDYVAAPPRGMNVPLNKLAEAPLELVGFYAYNAHLVQPAWVSLGSIENALKTGVFTDVVELSVAFPTDQGWVADPTLTYTFTFENGQSKTAKGPAGTISASMGSWDYTVHVGIQSPKNHTLSMTGRLQSAPGGRMRGIVVPTKPSLTSAAAFSSYLVDGTQLLELEVELEGKTAPLTITGSVQGVLGKGLGVEGTFVSIRRTHKGGHRSQYGENSSGADPPHFGYNIEISTGLGTLWLAVDLEAVDDLIPKGFEDGLELQSLLMLAVFQKPLRFKASGAVSGEGELRLPASKHDYSSPAND